MKHRDPRIRPWAKPLATVALVVTAVAMGFLILFDGLPELPDWLRPSPDNIFWLLLLVGSASIGVWALWMRKRGESFRPEIAISVSAVGAVLLGSASYIRCGWATDPTGVFVGVLNLFTGDVESALIGPEAVTDCQDPYPLPFQLARLFGLTTLVFSAIAILDRLARPLVDRFRVRWARLVDVVVGLDETTFPLVEALCEERDRAPKRPTWYRRRLPFGPAWKVLLADWVTLLRPRPTVVVIHENEADHLITEARAFGALVYIGDPEDRTVLETAILRGKKVVLNRLYAVSGSQADNVKTVEQAQEIIAKYHPPHDNSWLAENIVPRLIARFTDPREARDWRLRKVSAAGCLMDALTADELLARTLVERLTHFGTTDLVITGDTPLAVTILDQVTLKRAFLRELEETRKLKNIANPPQGAAVEQLSFESVTIVADTAKELCSEWLDSRAPNALVPSELQLVPTQTDWPEVVESAISPEGRPAVIITEPASPLISARATRLSARHPGLLVLRPSNNLLGVEPLPLADRAGSTPGAVVRFGRTLVDDGYPPEDTWTVLSRQQHEIFCLEGNQGLPSAAPSRQPWKRGGEGLPEFFREDNFRQHRHLLMALEQQGFEWRAARAGGDPAPEVPNEKLMSVALEEHQRWYEYRKRNGWQRPPSDSSTKPVVDHGKGVPQREDGLTEDEKKTRNDQNRYNAHFKPCTDDFESTALALSNVKALEDITKRLSVWGVEPWSTDTDESVR